MSVETLILAVLLIVLPLLQQLIRATRQRNERPPEPAAPRPVTLARTPLPEGSVPPLPDTTPPVLPAAMPAGDAVPALRVGAPVTTTLTPGRTIGERAAVALRTPRDMRGAVVLAAILGPCRANRPYRSRYDD
jgi:hypothetical protein